MSLKWKLLIAIVGLYILGMVGVGWSTYDAAKESGSPITETVKITFIMLGGLGVILPTYLNIWQSLENNSLIKETKKERKVENSFHLLSKWDDPSLIEARSLTSELKRDQNNISANKLIKRINENQDVRMSVILLLNYFDLVRTSIKHERVDKEIIKASLGRPIVDICNRLEPFIKTLPPTEHFKDLLNHLK